MASTSAAISFLPTRSISPKDQILRAKCWNPTVIWRDRVKTRWISPIRACAADSIDTDKKGGGIGGDGVRVEVPEEKVGFLEGRTENLKEMVAELRPVIVAARRNIGLKFSIGACFGVAFLAIIARQLMLRSREHGSRGSVSDLIRRGQLKTDRRGIAKPRLYDDPFNNPLVKIDESNSTARMFGKDYRLAPVRLTKEQQSMHQKRRSRAYQWKRPTVFLREGDSIPPDVDPDTVRWIPSNHPFASTSSDIDEEIAKKNVYQKDGVPFRVKAEHEALQKQLQTLKGDPKFSAGPMKMSDHDGPFKSSGESLGKVQEQSEPDTTDKNQNGDAIVNSDHTSNHIPRPERLEER